MDHFNYQSGQLMAEDVSLAELAEQYGTPLFVYSKATLVRHLKAYSDSLADYPHMICYGMKANSNLAVLQCLAQAGAGFDIVSQGELERVILAGGDPAKVVFSGVGKQPGEMRRALEAGIHCFNVESESELEILSEVASSMGKTAPVSIRVNPDVDAQTHPYISTGLRDNKFGIPHERALEVYRRAQALPGLKITGIDCHIGSQLTDVTPLMAALEKLLELIDTLKGAGIELEHIDLGGGLGVPYQDEEPPHPSEYLSLVKARLAGSGLSLVLEPGRSIAANAGVMLTRVNLLKENHGKHFAVVDGAMNDLIRPSLYSAWQRIIPVMQAASSGGVSQCYDVVGPVCESGDFLGKDRDLTLAPGDLLAVRSAGAYSFVMSSNYNTRPRAAEILVDGDQAHLVRKRETYADLLAHESLIEN
jgi:diaminopimelate decarboxylase